MLGNETPVDSRARLNMTQGPATTTPKRTRNKSYPTGFRVVIDSGGVPEPFWFRISVSAMANVYDPGSERAHRVSFSTDCTPIRPCLVNDAMADTTRRRGGSGRRYWCARYKFYTNSEDLLRGFSSPGYSPRERFERAEEESCISIKSHPRRGRTTRQGPQVSCFVLSHVFFCSPDFSCRGSIPCAGHGRGPERDRG
jgi:hypothetical protein